MSTITRLYLQAIVTKTAAFTGSGVSVATVLPSGGSASAVPSQVATLVIHVASLDTGATARIQITDSADTFDSDIVAVYVAHIQGGLGQVDGTGYVTGGDQTIRIPWYDIPDARFGVTSAKMRVDVTSLAASPSGTVTNGLTYEAWIEY